MYSHSNLFNKNLSSLLTLISLQLLSARLIPTHPTLGHLKPTPLTPSETFVLITRSRFLPITSYIPRAPKFRCFTRARYTVLWLQRLRRPRLRDWLRPGNPCSFLFEALFNVVISDELSSSKVYTSSIYIYIYGNQDVVCLPSLYTVSKCNQASVYISL